MARFFDAQAALAEIRESAIRPIHPIPEPNRAKNRMNRVNRVPPDTDFFEERAAIIEFDAHVSLREAEDLAAQSQGYGDVVEFRTALQKRESRREP